MPTQTSPAANPTATIAPYQYWAKVVKIVDGDTLDLAVEIGFELTMQARVRLVGIDTPEMFGVRQDTDEYRAGVAARDRVAELIPDNGWIEIRTMKSANREKYGRWLCEAFVGAVSINQTLVAEGHATQM